MASHKPTSLGPIPVRDVASQPLLSPQLATLPSSSSSRSASSQLTSKVNAVVSTSYADAEFRDVLSLVDARGISNTPETRRRLRLQLQREVIASNGLIITEFGRVAEQLRHIGSTLDGLNRTCQQMRTRVVASHEQTWPILQESSSLIDRRNQVEVKAEVLRRFRGHFLLSKTEANALTLMSEPVDDGFFKALDKAKKIRKDCEILLGYENQTLGLELMEETSKHINVAFQKLYKWTQRQFKTLNLENPQMNASIRRALCILAEKPSLFRDCLDYFAEARGRILSDTFHAALTGESPSGDTDPSMKPIELTAHDPLRYVGDMLAWTHSTTVSEREALEVLFISEGDEIARGMKSGRDSEPWQLVSEEDGAPPEFDPVQALNDLVDRDISGASRMLHRRVEQVIQSNEETILAYKLANLVGFYRITFAKLLGPQSVLVESISSAEAEALRQFRSLMRDHIVAVQGEFQQMPYDLGAPGFLQDAIGQLTAIMKTYDTSLGASGDRLAEFAPILEESLDPFLEGCEAIARRVESPSRSIFIINCTLAVIHALEPFEFTHSRVHKLEKRLAGEAEMVTKSLFLYLCHKSGVGALFESVSDLETTAEDGKRLRSLPPFQPRVLEEASQVLDDFLPSALIDAMEQVKNLQDAALARRVTETATDEFCQRFEKVEKLLVVADEEALDGGNSEELRGFFPRTAGEIRVLLS